MEGNPLEWFVPLIWDINSEGRYPDSWPLIILKFAFNYAQFFGMLILIFAAIHFGWELV